MIDMKHDHKLAHHIGMSMLRQGTKLPRPTAEVLVEKAPSTRAQRRQRLLDSRATARKSRRTAFRKKFETQQMESNLRGIARIYFGHTVVSPGMFENVTRSVNSIAEQRAKENDETPEAALGAVETALLDILGAYDEDVA